VTAAASGLVVVDKPAGWTSHDVVARVRRLAGTRKVGHAGTLDPMATGVLVLGVERATRLLTYLVADDKEYTATIRLGASTVTDDAEGEVLATADPSAVTEQAVRAGVAALTGDLLQVPSSVSAIKVDGRRSYAAVRAGETPELAARPATVRRFDLLDLRRADGVLDLDVEVTVSSGTYVRALARDLGAGLGVGGHLTALRRTRSGRFTLAEANTLDDLERSFALVPLEVAVATAFPRLDVDAATAAAVRHGRRIPLPAGVPASGPVGVFAPDGSVLALLGAHGDELRPLVVLAPAG